MDTIQSTVEFYTEISNIVATIMKEKSPKTQLDFLDILEGELNNHPFHADQTHHANVLEYCLYEEMDDLIDSVIRVNPGIEDDTNSFNELLIQLMMEDLCSAYYHEDYEHLFEEEDEY